MYEEWIAKRVNEEYFRVLSCSRHRMGGNIFPYQGVLKIRCGLTHAFSYSLPYAVLFMQGIEGPNRWEGSTFISYKVFVYTH